MGEFQNTYFKAYSLDLLHSYTAPGIAWQAMLKETRWKIELMNDVDMLLMIRVNYPWWDYSKYYKTC